MKIDYIEVNKILDSRGEFTIEIEIESENLRAKVSIPSGKSLGSHEAICYECEIIKKKAKSFLKEIKDLNFSSSQDFDKFLIKKAGKNKKFLGANFTLALSLAFSKILAQKEKLPLYIYLKREYKINSKIKLPNMILNVIGGGVHSFNNLSFQEYWLVSKEKFSEKLIAKIISVINKLENILPKPLGRNDEGAFCINLKDDYEPFRYLKKFSSDFIIGSDIAANQLKKDIDFEKIKELEVKYLEDPFKEEEFEKFTKLRKMGFKIIGDDLTVTNVKRLKIAIENKSVDGVIVKPNQIGTISETYNFISLASKNNIFTIFSHRSGETNDSWLIDLGIAFDTDYFKIGVPLQGERVAKWNRLLEIMKNGE
ncbi:MAG: hypothetical protein NZ866_02800 [Patescibacteria group bacterium]|nr:hypothetical protein [Patescibacteria group bacterium]